MQKLNVLKGNTVIIDIAINIINITIFFLVSLKNSFKFILENTSEHIYYLHNQILYKSYTYTYNMNQRI